MALKKSHEPVRSADAASSVPHTVANPSACAIVKDQALGVVFVFAARASYSRTSSGGKRRIGCMPRYAAKDRARMKVLLAPWDALAMAVRMNRFVRAEVERARHVRTVKGLNKKLPCVSSWPVELHRKAYPAAMAVLLHFRSFLEDENSLDTEAVPL